MLFFYFLKSNLSKLSEEHIITAVNLLHMYINTKHSFHSYVLKKELLAREKKHSDTTKAQFIIQQQQCECN